MQALSHVDFPIARHLSGTTLDSILSTRLVNKPLHKTPILYYQQRTKTYENNTRSIFYRELKAKIPISAFPV